ncbi:methyltransferase [Nocardia sp. NPDC020380]|uniref:methyltransferase n=1 Tax=Nocardia sp. NPDC020380 TaxID=3364309 RepID=UPI00379955B4
MTEVSAAREIILLSQAYARARVLHSAVDVGLFELLAAGPREVAGICAALGLHPALVPDWLDALVGLDLLVRTERGYGNSAAATAFLVPGSPAYLGGAVAQHGAVHYPLWQRLTEALRDGHAKSDRSTLAGAVQDEQRDLERARRFLSHMDTFNGFVADDLVRALDWRNYTKVLDVGGARGNIAAALVAEHPHLRAAVFDLPGVRPLFDEHMRRLGTADQVDFHGGDFFHDPLPPTEVAILGHVLHDWPVESRRRILEGIAAAVQPGGALLIYDAMLETDAADPHGHVQSLICSMIRDGGSEYSGEDCRIWVEQAGFRVDRVIPLQTITRDRLLIAHRLDV